MAEKHIDGLTGQEFATHEEYLNHVSSVTGFKPTDIEHQGLTGIRIAKAALKRTDSLDKANDELDIKETNIRTLKIENKIKLKRHKNENEVPKKKKDRGIAAEDVAEEEIQGKL